MKLVYITSQKYPSAKVDPVEMRSTAEALSGILGKDFLFLVRGDIPKDLRHINVMSARVPQRLRIIFYFFLLPTLVIIHKWNDPQTVIFSQDPYLLAILIFWRRILRFQYLICSDWRQLFDDWRDNYVAKGSDLLVTTSKRLMSLLLFRCDISQEKILTAYGGVNKDIFEEKARKSKLEHRKGLGLPTEAFLVGYVGGFRSVGMEKGIDTMIKSLPFLGKKIMMIFVGGSKQVINEYVLLAMKEKVEDRCIFIEKQSFDKVIEYEMAMDILVIPYPDKPHFRDYGFPLKVWEYMASGRPIVYSNLEIIDEVLNGRGTSFQVGDPQSLAKAIDIVYQDLEQKEKVAKKNSVDVKAYTWEARAQNILNFINK